MVYSFPSVFVDLCIPSLWDEVYGVGWEFIFESLLQYNQNVKGFWEWEPIHQENEMEDFVVLYGVIACMRSDVAVWRVIPF